MMLQKGVEGLDNDSLDQTIEERQKFSEVLLESDNGHGDLKANQIECESVGVDSNCISHGPKSKIPDMSVAVNAGLSTPYINNMEETDANSLGVPERLLNGNQEESGSGKSGTCNLKDDDLLISAFLRNKTPKSMCNQPLRKRKSLMRSCKLSIQSPNKGKENLVKQKRFVSERRTVLSWLIHSGVLFLGDVIQYRDQKTAIVVKEGTITCDGVLCKCCNKLISMSEFEFHAGFRLNSPCLNLYMESGKPFTLSLLEAWSVEYKARKGASHAVQTDERDNHDLNCGRCGSLGDLICCKNCTSAFHQACLHIKKLPKRNWYCPQCTCQICGRGVNSKEALAPPGTRCMQCEHRYHEACVEQGIRSNVASDMWFCSNSCQEVYIGLQARIGFMNRLSDGCKWSLLKCIDGNQKAHSALCFLALKAACSSKLAVALTIMEECFSRMLDPTTGVDIIPQLVYNWGSKYARVNYSGFYTVVLEKDDRLVALASIRIHGVKVAEIPFVATSKKYRRQGMCRHLLNAIEHMLKSLNVEKLVISAIPSTVETWKAGFGFALLDDDEKMNLSNINLMPCPGSEYLKKPLCVNGQG